MGVGQVRVLTLEFNVDGSKTLYRLQQGWSLQFRLGPSLLGKSVQLWTNCPETKEDVYDRSKYSLLEWHSDSAFCKSDDTAFYAGIQLTTSGSFHYYITDEKNEKCGQGYFLVDPVLTIGAASEVLPLDSIQCQTFVTKNLGPFTGWEDKLRVAKEAGYNMIHFTPLQVRGHSDSAYSLYDMHDLDPQYACAWSDVAGLVSKMRDEWNMLSICDIVLNHAANNSAWVREHPECTYNLSNCPHLRPAFLLDRMFYYCTVDIDEGKWIDRGVPQGEVSSQAHLDRIREILFDHYLPEVKIPELFLVDVDKILVEFEKSVAEAKIDRDVIPDGEIKIIQDPEYRRFGSTIDLNLAVKHYGHWKDRLDGLRRRLEELNHQKRKEIERHLEAGVTNALSGARWERLADDGPKISACNRKHPLSRNYFLGNPTSLKEEEAMMYTDEGKFFMAHNGWVMGLDPTTNFADPKCNVYLRRELIAWGDSVKLNYGNTPDDCPFLWDYMKKYVVHTAEVFHGIRLDNCHSTPIHVAEYLLDAARKINPNLYVIAELFTGSEASDNRFVNRLGISSLIREALSAWDSHEQGRLVFRFGGEPVGSFSQPTLRPLIPSVAHAIFFDQTHDNPSSIEKRSVYDALPSSALVAMACCASGSVRGYDELVPHKIHVVKEKRIYGTWGVDVEADDAIIVGKKALNDLHSFLGNNGFNEVYVDQMDYDTVGVTRHCPITHRSVVMVAYTAFSSHVDPTKRSGLRLEVEGELVEVMLEARLVKSGDETPFEMKSDVINGLKNFKAEVRERIPIEKSKMAKLSPHTSSHKTIIDFTDLRPGSVIAFMFNLQPDQNAACVSLRKMLNEKDERLDNICSNLRLSHMNTILFRCDQEERDANGGGVYVLEGHPLCYAGLQGVVSLLAKIRPINDLGNWLPKNLRDGNWLLDYISGRLKTDAGTADLGRWLDEGPFSVLKRVPRYLIPRYFDAIITKLYCQLLDSTWQLMSPFVQEGSFFVKSLALGSVQHGAVVKSASLPALSPALDLPQIFRDEMVSCAAGLPHFSTGYMRNWGRDTFITLRGLFILTGRFEEARAIILAFGACLRHGLIPNLLDGGYKARFNCRDAIWWWLHCIKSYVEDAPNGANILKDPVSRIFPTDDSPPCPAGEHDQPLEAVIQEALDKHFQGLKFRERNAGKQIDEHMTDGGFNNEIGVDLETGFVFGGNVNNCGTWMDKMGSSYKAGNKGKPATPRDGSAVELVGLSYACLRWLADLSRKSLYSFASVKRSNPDVEWSFDDWADKIEANFEKHFRVFANNPDEKRTDLVHKTDIYKDTLGSGYPWCDYQLRCNVPIAMAVAPQLFKPENAWKALQVVRKKLLGPLGIATLDPDDWNYRGNYDNSNDSTDPTVANGFNYHQGPEWVWPVGYFLRAYLHFARLVGGDEKWNEAKKFVMSVLSAHFVEVQSSEWRGIPELTNAKGQFCPGSNPIQAWSMACLLEVLVKIEEE